MITYSTLVQFAVKQIALSLKEEKADVPNWKNRLFLYFCEGIFNFYSISQVIPY
ncbi:hypothetical protein [Neobacillus cucumis]|uniref:hypothetical protein n=1 Tax=Neobacillus cucumis TaxID=1740721 RepID=UPI002E1DBE63|nr:hypothetical protein [Neobacillus cucumis]